MSRKLFALFCHTYKSSAPKMATWKNLNHIVYKGIESSKIPFLQFLLIRCCCLADSVKLIKMWVSGCKNEKKSGNQRNKLNVDWSASGNFGKWERLLNVFSSVPRRHPVQCTNEAAGNPITRLLGGIIECGRTAEAPLLPAWKPLGQLGAATCWCREAAAKTGVVGKKTQQQRNGNKLGILLFFSKTQRCPNACWFRCYRQLDLITLPHSTDLSSYAPLTSETAIPDVWWVCLTHG